MHRKNILRLLDLFAERAMSVEERVPLARMREFIGQNENCFSRENLSGHLTGSALITDVHGERVLLTLHKKLGKWLQLGGHADGDPDLAGVARREAEEESGLSDFTFHEAYCAGAEAFPFDIDVHAIPARSDQEPHHLHWDVRFLLVAQNPEAIQISEESSDLKWFSLAEALAICPERSMQRQLEKLAELEPLTI